MISIGFSVTAARSLAEDASLFVPVATLSVITAWSAFTVVVCSVQYAAPHKPFNMCRMVQNEMLDTCGNDGVLNAQ